MSLKERQDREESEDHATGRTSRYTLVSPAVCGRVKWLATRKCTGVKQS